jgi:hypothetical protein
LWNNRCGTKEEREREFIWIQNLHRWEGVDTEKRDAPNTTTNGNPKHKIEREKDRER